jgi:hypothetical protein
MSPRRLQRTPLQVYLEPRQLELLRDLADRRQQPLTHLVRESLDRYLIDEMGDEDPLHGLTGLIDSGTTDTARDHDIVLNEHQLRRIGNRPDAEPPGR